MAGDKISEREMRVLGAIVANYIVHGTPLGSRAISKQPGFGVSSATIRNVMMDLEECGFVTHPHTSAGRIPTDRGYRFYVDHLMKLIDIPDQTKKRLRHTIVNSDPSDLHMLMEATSKALSIATDQLGVVLAPKLSSGVFRHVHIHEVEPKRFLLHLTIDSGFVRTMVVELETELDTDRLERACSIMNRRFHGMRLEEMEQDETAIFQGVDQCDVLTIRLFVPAIRRIIEERRQDEIFAEGQTNIILKPEFFDTNRIQSIIEILQDRRLLVHLFKEEVSRNNHGQSNVVITIGRENRGGRFGSFSVVRTNYKVGNMGGTLGIVGPTRMPYGYLVSAVKYTADLLNETYS